MVEMWICITIIAKDLMFWFFNCLNLTRVGTRASLQWVKAIHS